MKSVLIAFLSLIIILSLITSNTIIVSKSIESIIDILENTENSVDEYKAYEDIHSLYMKKQKIIALTISHEDLRDIENDFHEILGAIKANNEESLIIAKSRLLGSLRHIKRLSGINSDSIF